MFRISTSLMATFGHDERERFIRKTISMLREIYPEEFPADDTAAKQFIHRGIKKAGAHEINREPDVCKFLALMLELGPDFDTDPKLPWASEILKQKGFNRIQLLIESARHYLQIHSAH